ncbi:MAG: hypothetical protein H6512_07685 [Acidimicrobiia bacterium]|nr:hypothetical protein [Acidimicrobiia bacterium]
MEQLGVRITDAEAQQFMQMTLGELIAFLNEAGLPIPARIKRLDPSLSAAGTLSRGDLQFIIAPLQPPADEPRVRGVAGRPDDHAAMTAALETRFGDRIGLIGIEEDGSVVVPVRSANADDRAAAAAIAQHSRSDPSRAAQRTHPGTTECSEVGDFADVEGQDVGGNWGVGILLSTETVFVSLLLRATTKRSQMSNGNR